LFKYMKRLKFLLKFWKFIPFSRDFFLSKEVPFGRKVLGVSCFLIYWFFPFDIIPDFLTFFGIVDDVVIAGFLLERMVKMAPESLKIKHGLLENT
jgi:uncharacterized membrane protein YkvA (DUF1232 family)